LAQANRDFSLMHYMELKCKLCTHAVTFMSLHPIRICIIEDHAIVRAGIKMLLAAQPDLEVVGEAVDREGALEIAMRESPDLFVVDLQLGTESAVDFLEELLASCEAKAIVLTGIFRQEQIQHAISAGATGVVYKTEAAEVLLRAIRKVQAGEAWLSRSLVTSALGHLRATASSTARDPNGARIATLTTREREIVALMASGVNRKRIAEQLRLSETTIRNHLNSVFTKLELSSQLELVFYAQSHGLNKPSS